MVDKKLNIKDLCKYCFNVLDNKLNKNVKLLNFPQEFKEMKCPLFVTWKIEDELRGCIGTFSEDFLIKILPQYALISALEDTRFDPISVKELPLLNVSVSLLTDFEEAKDCYDWEVGIHGIKLFYKNYSSTFLPEVASEQGWDKKTTLQYLLKKSGSKANFDNVYKDIKIVRYQSQKDTTTYKEYISSYL